MLLIVVVVAAGALAAVGSFIASARHRGQVEPVDPDAGTARLRRFIASHPAIRRFLHDRLDRTRAGGLMLTIAFVLVFSTALILGTLLAMIGTTSWLGRSDISVSHWGADHATASAVDVFKLITQIGASPVVLAYLTVTAVIDYVRRRNREVFAFVAAVGLGAIALNNVLKWIVRRNRPDVLHLVAAHGFSFPSGHTCSAAAATSAVALILGRDRHRLTRAALAALAMLASVAVATSRALLGVHWLSDVLGGLAVGWSWFLLVAVVFGGRRQRLGEPTEHLDPQRTVLADRGGATTVSE